MFQTSPQQSERFPFNYEKQHFRETVQLWSERGWIEVFDSYFLWQEERVITKYGYISLHKNQYRIKDVGIGEKVSVRYDPFDLHTVYVYHKRQYIGPFKAYKFKNTEQPVLPQENKTPPAQVSQAARKYFENMAG